MIKTLAIGLTALALSASPSAWGQAAPGSAELDPPKAGCAGVVDQPTQIPEARSFTYKSTGTRPLRIHVFEPTGAGKHPAIIFFFGGGFRIGKVDVFSEQAKAYAARGYVAALADYRVSCRDQTNPVASVEDGEAAYAWLRAHSAMLHVDTKRIVLSGGSSGGFVAAAAALLASKSAEPAAVVLFNPATDLRPALERFKLSRAQASAISPAALPLATLPPTVIFHGKADRTVPIAMVRDFCQEAKTAGRECVLFEYEGQDHSFYHSKAVDPHIGVSPYDDTLRKALEFLERLPAMRQTAR